MKTVILYSLSTPDNPEMGYNDYVSVYDGKDNLWAFSRKLLPESV